MPFVEPLLLVIVTVLEFADFVTQILPAVIEVANALLGSEIKVMVDDAYPQKNTAPVPTLLSETIKMLPLATVTLKVPSFKTEFDPVKIRPLFVVFVAFIAWVVDGEDELTDKKPVEFKLIRSEPLMLKVIGAFSTSLINKPVPSA